MCERDRQCLGKVELVSIIICYRYAMHSIARDQSGCWGCDWAECVGEHCDR